VPRRLAVLLAALSLGLGVLVAAGCGSDSSSSSGSGSGSGSSSTPAAKSLRVGLVTDIGGLNDRSFNQLANEGLQKAKTDLDVQVQVLPSKSNADYVPNLSTLAQRKFDLVIGVGFLMADAVDTVATKFPTTKFAVIDVDQSSLKHKPANVQGLLFSEQQSG
jgi:basic membrane protein A